MLFNGSRCTLWLLFGSLNVDNASFDVARSERGHHGEMGPPRTR